MFPIILGVVHYRTSVKRAFNLPLCSLCADWRVDLKLSRSPLAGTQPNFASSVSSCASPCTARSTSLCLGWNWQFLILFVRVLLYLPKYLTIIKYAVKIYIPVLGPAVCPLFGGRRASWNILLISICNANS